MNTIRDFAKTLTFRKTAIILAVVGLILYANTFTNRLFWDDFDSVVHNQYIRSWEHFPKYFSENLTAGSGIRDDYWRPLLLVSFSVDYKLGKLTPFVYHLQNLFWHVLAAVLVFVFIKKILKKTGRLEDEVVNLAAFVASLLFLVHPLQTEAVTYVAGRGDPMHSALMLGSLIMFLKCLEVGSSTLAAYKNKYLYYSLILFVLALLAKERAVVLAGVVGLYLILFYGKSIFDRWKEKTVLFLPYFLIAVVYLVLRMSVLRFTDTFDFGAEQYIGTATPVLKLFLFLKGFAIYEGLLVWPAKLYMEKSISVPHSFFEPLVLTGFITLVAWIGAIGYSWRKGKKLLAFGGLWFFGTMAPSLHVFPIQGLLYEHWLYFPMIGFLVIIGVFVSELILGSNVDGNILLKSSPNGAGWYRGLAMSLLVIFLAGFSIRTMVRNNDWREPIRFYEKNVALGGSSARVFTNLGMAYDEAGQHEKAIKTYDMAISLDDRIFPPWYDKGNSYRDLGDSEHAIQNYDEAIKRNPDFISSYMNIAAIYFDQGSYDEAVQALERGMKVAPNNMQILYNLGIIYLKKGDNQKAKEYLSRASDLDPKNFELWELQSKIK